MYIEYTVKVYWHERAQGYVARCDEYEHLSGFSTSPEQACIELRESIIWWLNILKQSAVIPKDVSTVIQRDRKDKF